MAEFSYDDLLDRLIKQESGGDQSAVSPKGALGVMQVMPDTAKEVAAQLGIPFDPNKLQSDVEYNKKIGKAYLNNMLKKYSGNPTLALAAYNGGPGKTDEWISRFGDPRKGQISDVDFTNKITFPETKNYVNSILKGQQGNSMALSDNDKNQKIEQYKQLLKKQGLQVGGSNPLLDLRPPVPLRDIPIGRIVQPEGDTDLDVEQPEGMYFNAPMDQSADYDSFDGSEKPRMSPVEPPEELMVAQKPGYSDILEKLARLRNEENGRVQNLDMLRGANQIAQAIAAGYGGKIGDGAETIDRLQKSAGRPAEQLKEQMATKQNAIGLQQLEEKALPDSPLARIQQKLMSEMAKEAGVNIGDLSNISSQNANDIMTQLGYMLKNKNEKDLKLADRQRKLEEQAKLSDKQTGDVKDFEQAMGSMDDALDALGDHSDWLGTFDSRVPDALTFGGDQTAFRSKVGRISDAYRKLITGAAASDPELKRLEGRLPNTTDYEADFHAKAKDFITEVKKAKARYLETLARQGKSVDNFRPEMQNPGVNQFPKTVYNTKLNKQAIVQNEQELAQANAKGFQ